MCEYCGIDGHTVECCPDRLEDKHEGRDHAHLRDSETRDDDRGHGSNIVARQLAEAEPETVADAEAATLVTVVCPDGCGFRTEIARGALSATSCPDCGCGLESDDDDREIRADGGGLYDKYTVLKDGEPVDSCFVLEPESDPAACDALETYAAETENDGLAADLREWVAECRDEEHTHHCEDCETKLALLYDGRDDETTPIVCGNCGGTNTRPLEDDDQPDATTCSDCGADVLVYDDGTVIEPRDEDDIPSGMMDLLNYAFKPHDCDDDEIRTDGGQPSSGGYVWDHEDCPRSDCEGELQQQDAYNVMCLACEGVWTHYKTDSEHRLITAEEQTVASKPRVATDGGERIADSRSSSEDSSDVGPIDWYCPDCGEHHRTHTGAAPSMDCLTCRSETDWQREPPASDPVRADGGVPEREIVVSLCDHSGNMVRPWAEAGYECYAVDLKNDDRTEQVGDGMIHYVGADVREWTVPDRPVRIGFGFPPCTHLAVSGARWFQDKGLSALAEAIALVAACQETLADLECPWMLENPKSTLSTHWRAPDYKFDPYQYDSYTDRDERYTKETWLWTGGGFRMPKTDGVREHDADDRIHKMPPSEDRNEKRAETPMGFARAVFLAHEREGYDQPGTGTVQGTLRTATDGGTSHTQDTEDPQ